MRLLAIDPSSTSTGYALMDGPLVLHHAGLLKPLASDSTPLARIFRLADDLRSLMVEELPEAVVIETPHGKVHRRMQTGAGQSIYGMAAGAQLIRWRKKNGEHVVFCAIDPNTWTHGSKKLHRQLCVASDFPGRYRKGDDPGGDVSDAIALGQWWFRQREQRRATA